MELITGKLILVSFFLIIITMIETLAYSTRISGARVKLVATALSLFSTMVIISRFSTMFQQPLTAKLMADAPHLHRLEFIQNQYRILIGVTTLGVCLGILLFPTFISLFSRAIIQLSHENGSILILLKRWFNFKGLLKMIACFRRPRLSDLRGITLKTIPKRLFVINVLITSIYTVGVLSSLYASVIVKPSLSPAACLSSGIINGIATILLTLFIDPKVSVLADKVVKNQNRYIFLKSYSITMISSKFLGTVFAQILFLPAAYYVAWFSKFI
jgi:hypothetical protein